MNLNIWYYLPNKYLDKLPLIFSQMDGWLGSGMSNPKIKDSGFWFSYSIDKSVKYICCLHEPSGLHFNANMEREEWEKWKVKLKKVATEILGFNVGEPEIGDCDYDFGHEYAGK